MLLDVEFAPERLALFEAAIEPFVVSGEATVLNFVDEQTSVVVVAGSAAAARAIVDFYFKEEVT